MARPAQLRGVLTTWILSESSTEVVRVNPRADGAWQVAALLFAMWDDTETLPGTLAAYLRVPSGTTFGHVARLLWSYRDDHDIPCRDHTDAVELLRGLPDAERRRHLDTVERAMRGGEVRLEPRSTAVTAEKPPTPAVTSPAPAAATVQGA